MRRFLLFFLFACASRPPPSKPVEQEPIGVDLSNPPPEEPPWRRECSHHDPAGFAVVSLTRQPCAGDCPVYQVTVDSRGNVRWRGVAHVKEPMLTTALAPPAGVRDLVDTIVASCFFDMDDEYPAAGNDQAWAVVTVNLGSETKTVRHHPASPNAPPALKAIEDKIDEAAQTARWR